jgi:hypothetical protein
MEHIAIPLGEIHPPFNWKFANSAAREAATVAAEEVDCVALQLDTAEIYRLVSVSPAVWQRVGGSASGSGYPAYVAAEPVSGHQVIALDSAGEAVYATADDASFLFRVVGVSANAATTGALVTVQNADVMEHGGWSWTPGDTLFLGLGGGLVNAVPPTAAFVLVVGRALSATRILIGLQSPIVR